jgi:DNA-binding GntR family transcriptional regulator
MTSTSLPADFSKQPFDPIDSGKSSRAEHVMSKLRHAILNGHLKPGQRLRETEIASWLGVSRTPVREALHRLTEAGLLAPTVRGMMVVSLSQREVVDLYAMREALEATAAGLAAKHALPFEVEQLKVIVQQMDRETNDERLRTLNMRFHEHLYSAAHNTFLIRALQGLTDAITLLPGTTFSAPGRPETAVEQHHLIVEALERHDSDTAEKAARQHIRDAMQLRLQMMFKDEAGVS